MTLNLAGYDRGCVDFLWLQAAGLLTGLSGNARINIAYEVVYRHAAEERANHLALR